MSDRQSAPKGGLSLQTLLISSASAVIATVVVSQFWAAGTLFFTALVPVAVALISEILRRPAEKITEVAPLVAPRMAPLLKPDRTEVRDPDGVADRPPLDPPEPPGPPGPPVAARGAGDDPFGLYAPERRRILTGRVLRVGLVTGLLAFVLAGAFITASELALLGNSIGERDRRTTLVGGSSSKADEKDAPPTPTPDTGGDPTPAPTPAATPGATATPDPRTTPSPTPGSSPTATPSPAAAPPTPTPATPGGARSP